MLREQHLPKERLRTRRVLPGEARGLLGVAGEPLGGQADRTGLSHNQEEEPHLLNNLRKNVCFLHNPDKKLSPQFVMHCDWCSLLNGICHTIKTNAGNGDEAARVIGVASRDFERAEAYMRFAMASRNNEDDDAFLRDADAYCEENFGSTHESLRVFSRFALRLERVELVWCPFKRCAEDYYRNADERYANPSPEEEEALYKRLGAMLGDTVECKDCALEFNAEFPMEGSNTRSIYQGLLDARVIISPEQ